MITITVHVTPSAGRQQWALDKAGRLKCYLKSAAEKGKANEELVKLLSKTLKLPHYTIRIVSGATSRKKLIVIDHTVSLEQLYQLLGISYQQSIS